MLTLQIYATASKTTMLADYTGRLRSLRFGTNARGFSSLAAVVGPMGVLESFECYEWLGLPHVVVSDTAAAVVWEGRLEDIDLTGGGLSLTAFGYARAMGDAPYSAVWSVTSTADWEPSTYSNATPDRYEMDNNNRLYIAPREGETINDDDHYGVMTWAIPHGSARNVNVFTADYEMVLPTNWKLEIVSADDDFTNQTVIDAVTGNGSTQTGSISETGINKPRLMVRIHNDTGGNVTISATTGTNYVKLTATRIKTGVAATNTAGEIAAALAVWVNAINSGQLSASDELVSATTTDLRDEVYEDVYPDSILDRLALLHGYEWGVYEGQRLHWRARGSGGRHWYVDALGLPQMERSINKIVNSAYSLYRDAAGRTKRTATADDADSQARYGIVRRGLVKPSTTSQTEAETHRDVYLADRAEEADRANVAFSRIYDAIGARYPLYAMRAGDTVTVRNLPPTLSTAVNRLRTFVIGETDYNALSGAISVAPREPVPTLVTLIARREAGL